MASYNNDENNIKSIWCRSYYGMKLNQQGYKITEIYPCKFGDKCHGAHTSDEIIEKSKIKKWKKADKSNINILDFMERVINILEKNREMIQNPKYRAKIPNIHKMRIDELLMFWYEVFYYHHNISKKLPTKKAWTDTKSKPPPVEGYNYKDDVPNFYIDNEDIWDLERMLHMCPKHLALDKTVRTSVKDICVGDINCKEGAHDINDLICISNLITGSCGCVPLEEYDITKSKIIDDITKIQLQLNPPDDDDGFTVSMTKKRKDELTEILALKKKELINLKRMVHLTEKGLVPLDVQIEIKKQTNPKPSEEVQVKKANKIVKPKF
jgi:hypothetical protein